MNDRFEHFTLLIAKINRNIRKIKNQAMADYDLKAPHISCLYYLYTAEGELTATDLCERCEEDKATVSRSLTYLEKNGYLTRDASGARRYKSPLHLTERGRAVGQTISNKVRAVLKKTGEGISDEERASFYKLLTLISDTLELLGNTTD